MASTTKLMTALLTIENTGPDEEVVISRRAEQTNFKQIGLVTGQTWTVGELLEGLVVVSANDAAVALAEYVSGDVETFVDAMNDRATELGLANTSYSNPHGFDAPDQYTTARDLLHLSREAMRHPEFAALAATPSVTVQPVAGRERQWESTNELLTTVPGVIGVKTGKTRGAGEVLVSAAERDGRRIYAVVMGATNATRDAGVLLEYGFSVFGSPGLRLNSRKGAPVEHATLMVNARRLGLLQTWGREDGGRWQ